MNEDRAFSFLARASSHGNIKLRHVAQELVDQQNTREPGAFVAAGCARSMH